MFMVPVTGETVCCLLELRAANSRLCCWGVRMKSFNGLRVDAIGNDGYGNGRRWGLVLMMRRANNGSKIGEPLLVSSEAGPCSIFCHWRRGGVSPSILASRVERLCS